MMPDRIKRFLEANKRNKKLIDQCRWQSAIRAYQQQLNEFPEQTIDIAYNFGAFYQHYVGDAEEARRLLEMAVNLGNQWRGISPSPAVNKVLDEVIGNACENLMLLSLSYEEYDKWAAQLESLQPKDEIKNEILLTQRPEVHAKRDQGLPWSDVLMWMSASASNADRHADAAAISQLLLMHRQTLRLSRQDHSVAVRTFASCRLLICGNAGARLVKLSGYADIHEISFLIKDAIPFLEEYLKDNSSDTKAQETLSTLQEALGRMEAEAQRQEGFHFPVGGTEDEGSVDPQRVGCVALLIGAVFSLVAGIGLLILQNNGGEVSGLPALVLSTLAIISSFFLIGGFRLRFGDKERYNRFTRR